MTPRTITWLTFAGAQASPMGLQHYELLVLAALRSSSQIRWAFTPRTVSALRSTAGADVRLPLGLLGQAPPIVARGLGAWAGRGAEHVHRFDLRLPPSRAAEVVTVHDLPPLRFDDEGALPRWSVLSAKKARLVICPSEFAASEVADLLGVVGAVVVPNGVSDTFRNVQLPQPWPATWPRRYVLHVGGATRRKNLAALGAAWKHACDQLPGVSLVLVGPPDERRTKAVAGCPRVVETGYLPQFRVAQLMAGALAVVVPSVYEGFGLPALEAMAVGTPVVAARAGALPEVCGDAAALVEPTPDALAGGLIDVCSDASLRSELAVRGRARAGLFTWESAAAGHLRAYDLAFG